MYPQSRRCRQLRNCLRLPNFQRPRHCRQFRSYLRCRSYPSYRQPLRLLQVACHRKMPGPRPLLRERAVSYPNIYRRVVGPATRGPPWPPCRSARSTRSPPEQIPFVCRSYGMLLLRGETKEIRHARNRATQTLLLLDIDHVSGRGWSGNETISGASGGRGSVSRRRWVLFPRSWPCLDGTHASIRHGRACKGMGTSLRASSGRSRPGATSAHVSLGTNATELCSELALELPVVPRRWRTRSA
jgi:hypothetical protein